MRPLSKIFALLAIVCAASFQSVQAQSVLDPNDPIVNYNSANPPTEPPAGQIGKWVRTPLLNWNTSSWKCYIYNGVAFRLKFPKTYNPAANDGKRYPMMVFFHGLGEAGPITDNEFQLYHGAEFFTQAVDNGTYDGYILFMQSQGYWGGGHYDYIKDIINYMVANNKLDPFRVSNDGLSAGGQACWEMDEKYPSYISSSLPISWVSYFYGDSSWVNKLKYTPIWNFQGGLDGAPTPYTAQGVRDAYLNAGGNYKYTEYPDLGHGTWDRAWSEPDFFPFQLRAYASNPWPLNGRTEFCPGDVINTTLGVAPGFDAYEWRKDGTVIQTGTSNTLQVTQTGTYDLRVLRGTLWSEWSRVPVQIKIKGPTVSPNITVSGLASRVLPGLDGSTSVKLEVPDGYATYEWQKQGDPTVLSTTRFLTTSSFGDYKVKVTERFGCSSDFSNPIAVVDANGPNKPDAAINLLATTLSKTSIRLDWSDNPAPQYNETNFEIYMGTQSGGPYVFKGITGADVKTFTVTGLNPSTKYYFRVRAVNNSGAASPSNQANGTTQLDTQAPTAPRNLTITSTTRNSISISWTASTDDVGVTLYEIYLNGVKTFATTNTNFLLSGLQTPNSYNITVRARDYAGNFSPFSNQVTGQPLLRGLDYKYYSLSSSPDSLPDFSNLVPLTTGTSSNLSLIPRTSDINFGFLWEGYINIPVSGNYNFRINSDDGSRVYLGSLNGQGSPYGYSAVPLVNNDGNHGSIDATSATVSLTKGTYPIAIAYYQGVGGFNVNLSWLNPQTGGNYVAVPDSAFTDKPVVNGTVPAKPTNLSASAVSYKEIDLSWTDNSSNEAGFEIWRSTQPISNFTTIGIAPSHSGTGTVTYKDSTLNPNTKYYYRVRAINQFGESDFDKVGQGVDYNYYEVDGVSQLPDFNTLTPKKTGHMNNFGLGMQEREDYFQLKFSGTINLPVTTTYTFYLASDDGSKLYIDGFDNAHQVIDNDYNHGVVEKSGTKTLTAGPHTIYVTYFEYVAGQSLQVSISAPGLPKQGIPDSYLGVPLTNATTPPPPAVPSKPTNLVASGESRSSIKITWTDNATNETKYELYRSAGNNSNYILFATLPVNSTSYTDDGLFANAVYYYKVRAVGNSSNSAYSNEDSAKTGNTAPVITDIPVNRSAHVGISTVLNISAQDADGDVLTFTAQNLPSFATLVDNGNRTATLSLNPSTTGTYNNIRITVTDPHGGTDYTEFNLTVNNNYDPVISAVSNYTVDEHGNLNIPLSATDQNSGDVLSWSVTGLPNAFTLNSGTNGSATLALNPDYASAGNYQVQVTVSDGAGGYATRTFTLTVNDKDPNVNVYVRVRHDDYNTIGAPWNTVTSASSSGFLDEKNNTTSIGLNLPDGYNSGNSGPTTGNNSGVFPDAVLRDYYVFGAPWMNQTARAVITGLDPTRKYSLTLLGASNWDIATDNGSTNYTINGQTQSLLVQNNTKQTVGFNSISPAADGTITINMSKGTGASAGYLNAFVLTSLYDDGTVPIAPTELDAENITGQGVKLTWQNLAYNETGYEIHRATSADGPFTQIGVAAGADVNAYLDNTVSGNSTYYYKIRAVSVSNQLSAFSNVVSVQTTNRIPQINSISDITVKNTETISVSVTATDDASDQVTLTATGLPQFATFTDNGNGTGVISIQPQLSSVGLYKGLTIVAKDNNGGSSSTSFDLTVVDKDVTSLYLNFSEGSIAGKPWNNLTGWPNAGTSFTGLKDDRDSTWTSMSVTLQDGFSGVGAVGVRFGNGREIYPATVVRSGEYEQSTNTKRILVSGLDNNRKYNFVFFNSHDDGTDGTTNFTIGGVTVTLNAAYNSTKTVEINGVTPVSGQITINVSKAAGADIAYLNAMVIQVYTPASVPFVAPTDLRVASASRNTISLQWQDRSDNETGFEIYRAASGGSYSLVGTVGANVTSYTDADASLTPNTPYFYIVRAVKNTSPLYSNYSNVATAYTYAYSIYVNFNNSQQAALPWNNTATVPQQGFVWNNFRDENNAVTSVGMVETGLWAGMYTVGINTGNNSGIYPDHVMMESYGLFPGQKGSVKIKGLNLTMKYDFTFFASAQHTGDVNVAYTVNGKTVMLNAALNKSGTVTMYDIVPDQNGEVLIEVAPGTSTSQYGLLGALVIQGYTPVATTIPAPASSTVSTQAVRNSVNTGTHIAENIAVSAYPNPFNQYFTLTVSTETPDRLDILLFDINGKMVYQNRYGNLNSGTNYIRVQPDRVLLPGVYLVKAILGNRKDLEMIKVVKQ